MYKEKPTGSNRLSQSLRLATLWSLSFFGSALVMIPFVALGILLFDPHPPKHIDVQENIQMLVLGLLLCLLIGVGRKRLQKDLAGSFWSFLIAGYGFWFLAFILAVGLSGLFDFGMGDSAAWIYSVPLIFSFAWQKTGSSSTLNKS